MLEIGRTGQLYVVAEGTYATHPTHASADAVRHINFKPTLDPKNKRHSAEKKSTPGRAVRFDGRVSAAWDLSALLRPSGTLNTLPEASEILEAAFGTKQNITLSTTVNAGTGAVGGATLGSTTGLLVGQGVLITCPDGKKRVRRILTLPGANVVTWAPNLPAGQQPADAAAVKGLITYRLSTALALSLSISHYLKKTDASTAGMKRGILGGVVDKFVLTFDANGEAQFQASGPAANMTTGTTPAQPGAFTTVGGNPPSGFSLSELAIGNTTTVKWKKVMFDMSNSMKLRNDEGGSGITGIATEAYRVGYRDVAVGLDMHVEDETLVYDATEAGTNVALMLQHGFTEGMIHALSLPQVEFKVPDQDDTDDEHQWGFKGMALESADGQNDEAFLYIA